MHDVWSRRRSIACGGAVVVFALVGAVVALTSTYLPEPIAHVDRRAEPAAHRGAADASIPPPVLPAPLAGIAAGEDNTCVLREDGSVTCWGWPGCRVLHGYLTRDRTPYDPGFSDAVEVVAGSAHLCARGSDGTVTCCGGNQGGEVGAPEADSRFRLRHALERAATWEPLRVQGLTDVAELAAGSAHTCARRHDGTVLCWGHNGVGQLGSETSSYINPLPINVPNLSGIVGLAAAAAYTCALSREGTVRCWGSNHRGQLVADWAEVQSRAEPTLIDGITDAVELAVGESGGCVRNRDNSVACWGGSGYPVLYHPGDGPLGITGLNDVVDIAVGGEHRCARTTEGRVACWGGDRHGQLGDGTPTHPGRREPEMIKVGRVVALAAGRDHTCALLATDSVACWGSNAEGALGPGTEDCATPLLVPGL